MERRASRSVLLAGAIVLAAAAPARADDGAREAAREAYALGEQALDAGRYDQAAAEFARADALLPSDTALEAALEAVGRGTNPSLAVHLLRRAEARRSARVGPAVRLVEGRYASSLGRLRIDCPPAVTCSAVVDGEPFPAGTEVWATRGAHRVGGTVAGEPASERVVDVVAAPAASLTLAPAAPAQGTKPVVEDLPPPPRPAPSGLSPAWIWVGIGAAAVLGGVSVWSTIDLASIRDDFDGAGCAAAGSVACLETASAGRAATTRTVVLWSATGAAALATALTGAFLVRWGRVGVGVVPSGGGALLALRALE
jgi:hypothetical protein